jgi:protein gp37
MAEETLIAWANHTWNLAWGCTKVSPGCAHCYAETGSHRYGHNVWGANAQRRTFGEAYWRKPVNWNKKAQLAQTRRRCFTSSMCDNFEDHPMIETELAKLWPLIRNTPWLDWLLLTKRAERIEAKLPVDWNDGYSNVWLGVSIENNDYVWRADHLRKIPAAVRFVSYEPALGPLDQLNLEGIDWVIYGGESGPGFRPHDLEWPRQMRRRCTEAGIAFFYKQSAAHRTEIGTTLDGETIKEYPMPRRS